GGARPPGAHHRHGGGARVPADGPRDRHWRRGAAPPRHGGDRRPGHRDARHAPGPARAPGALRRRGALTPGWGGRLPPQMAWWGRKKKDSEAASTWRDARVLAGLEEDQLRFVEKLVQRRSLAAGETLLEEGEPGRSVYLVEKGT